MITEENGILSYVGDTFVIRLVRYTDPERKNSARNAARYLGKKDIDNVRRPLSIIRQGHVPEIFRGEFAEFEFEDVSKEVYDHLVTYTTRNMRVAGGNRALTSDGYTLPSDKMKHPVDVEAMIRESMDSYTFLLGEGETPQVARAAMPVNAKMNIFVYQFNFLTLAQSLFRQRIWEKGAQGNTVKVVQAMYELVHHVDPELWETFNEWIGEPAANWNEVRRKLKKKKIALLDFLGDINPNDHDKPLEQVLVELYGEQKSMW